MRKRKVVLSLMLVFAILMNISVMGAATDSSVNITGDIQPTENNREFEVTYTIDVDGGTEVSAPSVVLALDRSNSMLYSDEDGDAVVDSVKAAVISFIGQYFMKSVDGELALLFFGSNAQAHDNYKYYDNAQDAIDEVVEYYGYRTGGSGYNNTGRSWSKWNYNQGGTNIGEGFAQAAKTVEKHQKKNDANDVIILFSDGVATHYKKGNKTYQNSNTTAPYNNPYYNSATNYAVTEGIYAQDYADVITVGYFGAYSHYYYRNTLALAQNTLDYAQNAGFYTTNDTGYIDSIFDEIVDSLAYIGTGATITEVIEADFELVEGSISPAAKSITVNDDGTTTIVWDIGNLNIGSHEYKYKVKIKDDVYPSGKDNVQINDISSAESGLRYSDLDGNDAFEQLDELFTDIPSHDILPGVDSGIEHDNASKQYLIGDTAYITHDLSFSNQLVDTEAGLNVLFDFVKIEVEEYAKTLIYGDDVDVSDRLPFTEAFSLVSDDWKLTDNTLSYAVNDSASTDPETPELLFWEDSIVLELECLVEGDFDFSHALSYNLYNPYFTDPVIGQLDTKLVEDEIMVRNGQLEFNLYDDTGAPINSINVILDDGDPETEDVEFATHEYTTSVSGEHIMNRVHSGLYDIIVEMPSGYKLSAGHSYYVNDDGDVVFNDINLNYSNPIYEFDIVLKALDVSGISIQTTDGDQLLYRNNVSDDILAKMTFSPMVDMDEMQLPIVDTFSGSGDISINENTLVVRNSNGDEVKGFEMLGNRLIFSSAISGAPDYLPIDDYTAEFTITDLPANLSGQMMPNPYGGQVAVPGYTFDITVFQTTVTPHGSGVSRTNATTADEMTIVYDEVGPVIVTTPSTEDYLEGTVTVDVDILSEYTDLIEYSIVKVPTDLVTENAFNGIGHLYGFKSVDGSDSYHVAGTFDVTNLNGIEAPSTGVFYGNGKYAIKATDRAGNTTITIQYIENLVDGLLDLL